jgi:oxygen-independent coproporphyrinogen-3 oxidase
VTRYLAAVEAGIRERDEDDAPDRLTAIEDHVALGLRLREGLELDRFAGRFGMTLEELAGAELSLFLGNGVLERRGDRVRVADPHLLVTNEVLARLLGSIKSRAGLLDATAPR